MKTTLIFWGPWVTDPNLWSFLFGKLVLRVKTIWQNRHDPRSGSVSQGHRENWGKSMCTSFGEECRIWHGQIFDGGFHDFSTLITLQAHRLMACCGQHNALVHYRAWQINEINGINDINQINDGLINLCKLGFGLMWINDGLMRINDKK